jgi:hypothetical protein
MLAAVAFLALAQPSDGAVVDKAATGDGGACEAQLDDANTKARQLQLKGKLKDAADALTRVKGACFASLPARRQAWLVSDLALLHHKRNDDKQCLALLKQAPALEPESVVARALAFNTGLCGGGCAADWTGGGCEQVERGLVRRRVETGDKSFTSPACTVGSFPGSVGITPPSGQGAMCLALVAAASDDGTHWRCPKLAVIEKNARGQLKRKELVFGDGAVVDENQCCNITELAVKSGPGSTLVRLRGAGRDCTDGAGFGDYVETFRFDGASLAFDHADDVR